MAGCEAGGRGARRGAAGARGEDDEAAGWLKRAEVGLGLEGASSDELRVLLPSKRMRAASDRMGFGGLPAECCCGKRAGKLKAKNSCRCSVLMSVAHRSRARSAAH